MSNQAAALLVDCLAAQGCDRVFTVPGESFLPVLDALRDRTTIQTVTCRQEGGVAFMACADGTMTGRPGVAFVTRGPGATNASIGVHVAMQDSQPLILFIGDVGREMRDREGFQEVDFPAFFGPICKWAARIDRAERIPEYVARAYATAISGRPGPVVLTLPEDMLHEHGVEATVRPFVHKPAQPPCPDALAAMMAMIGDAAAPVAIIGGAGWHAKAREQFAEFAERIGLPVATAFRRQDAIAPSSPVYAGNLGYGPNPQLLAGIRAADLLLVVGARLGEATTDGYSLITPDHPGQQLIHVHPDPEELNRVYRTDLAIPMNSPKVPSCGTMARSSASMQALRPTPNGWHGPRRARPHSRSISTAAWPMCGRNCPPMRSFATARAILPAGGTASGTITASPASWPPPAGRWDTACLPPSPPRCVIRTAAWWPPLATAIS